MGERLRARREVWEVPCLAAIAVLALWGSWRCYDPGWVGDDLAYFRYGAELLHNGTLRWAWSPVFTLLNSLASLIPGFALHPIDLIGLTLAVGSTLALWWMLRAALPPDAALVAAMWWAFLWPTPLTMHLFLFTMSVWTVSCGFFLRGRWFWALIFAGLGMVDRIETALWLFALGLIVLFYGRTLGARWHWRLVYPLLPVVFVAAVSGLPARESRAWLAFSQHYGESLRQRLGGPIERDGVVLDPWSNWQLVMEWKFPGAEGPLQAVWGNPSEAVAHFTHNLAALPRSFARLFFAPFPDPAWLYIGLLLGLLATLLLGVWRNRRDLRSYMQCLTPAGWALVVSGLAMISVAVFVHPRREFLVIWSAPVFLLLTAVLAWREQARAPARVVVWIALLVAAAGWAMNGVCPPGTGPPPLRAALSLLGRELPRADHLRLVAVDAGYHVDALNRQGVYPAELWERSEDLTGPTLSRLDQLLSRPGDSYVLITERRLPDPDFARQVADAMVERGWRVLGVTADSTLYGASRD